MATEVAKGSCLGMAATEVSATSRVPSQSLELDIDDVELLVKDLMGVASQCMFGNDIHPLVDSIANRSLATITEDELLAISPRYGDIVYNMLSLRENYQCPVADLICDPLLPDVLDKDRNPPEMEAVLALAAVNSYNKSIEEENEMASSFLSRYQAPSRFLQSLAEESQNEPEPLPLSSSFPSGLFASDVQPPPSSPPALALGFGQPLGAAQPLPLCPYSFSSSTSFPPWGQQQPRPPSELFPNTQTCPMSPGSGIAGNVSPGAFTGRTHSRQFSLHEPLHKHARRDDESPAHSPSLPQTSSSSLPHYSDSFAPLQASNSLLASQGQLSALEVGMAANTPTSKSHSIGSLRQLLQDKPMTMPSSAPPPNDREQPSSSDQTHRRRHHHHRRQPSRLYQQSISQQISSSEEDSGHVDNHKKAHRKAKQQQVDSNPGPLSPSSCQIPGFPMVLFALGGSNSNLVMQSLTGSPSSLTSTLPCEPPPLLRPSSLERQSPCLASSNTDAVNVAASQTVDPGAEVTAESSQPLHKKEERTSRRYAPHAGMKLWEFLLKVLVDTRNIDVVRWISKEEGTFRVINSEGLARLWGEHKNRTEMNYDKLSRAMRYYYHKNLLDKAPKRLCYQFKYYSRWWEKLELADPHFKMASTPSHPPGSPPVMDNLE